MSGNEYMNLHRNRYRTRFYQNRMEDLEDFRCGTNTLSAINNYFDTAEEPSRPVDSFVTSPSFANILTSSRSHNASQLEENSPTNQVTPGLKLLAAGHTGETKSKASIISPVVKSREKRVSVILNKHLHDNANDNMEPETCVTGRMQRSSANTLKYTSKDHIYSSDNSVIQDPASPMSETLLKKRLSFQDRRTTEIKRLFTGTSKNELTSNMNFPNTYVAEKEPENEKKETEDFVIEDDEGNLSVFLHIIRSPVAAKTAAFAAESSKLETKTMPVSDQLACPERIQEVRNKDLQNSTANRLESCDLQREKSTNKGSHAKLFRTPLESAKLETKNMPSSEQSAFLERSSRETKHKHFQNASANRLESCDLEKIPTKGPKAKLLRKNSKLETRHVPLSDQSTSPERSSRETRNEELQNATANTLESCDLERETSTHKGSQAKLFRRKLFATKELIEGLLPENCGHINKPESTKLNARNMPLCEQSASPERIGRETRNKDPQNATEYRLESCDLERETSTTKGPQAKLFRTMIKEQLIAEGRFPKMKPKEASILSEVKPLETNYGQDMAEEDEFLICDVTETDKFSLNWMGKTLKCQKGNKSGQLQKKLDVAPLLGDSNFSNFGKILDGRKGENHSPPEIQNETFVVLSKKAPHKSSTSKACSPCFGTDEETLKLVQVCHHMERFGNHEPKPKHSLITQKKETKLKKSRKRSKVSEETFQEDSSSKISRNSRKVNKQGVGNMTDIETEAITRQDVGNSSELSNSRVLDVENGVPNCVDEIDFDGSHSSSFHSSARPAHAETFNLQSKSLQQSKRISRYAQSSNNRPPQADKISPEGNSKLMYAQTLRQKVKGKATKAVESLTITEIPHSKRLRDDEEDDDEDNENKSNLSSNSSPLYNDQSKAFQEDVSNSVSKCEVQNLHLEIFRSSRRQSKKTCFTDQDDKLKDIQKKKKVIGGPPNEKKMKFSEHDQLNTFSKQGPLQDSQSPATNTENHTPDFIEENGSSDTLSENPVLVNLAMNELHQNNLESKVSSEHNSSTEKGPPQQQSSSLCTPNTPGQSPAGSHSSFESGPGTRIKAAQNQNTGTAVRKLTYPNASENDDQFPLALVFDADTKSHTLSRCLNRMSSEQHHQIQSGGVWKSFENNIFTAGKIVIAPFNEEERSSLEFDILVFCVVNGQINLKLNNMWYALKTGDFFYVPPCNKFIIQNIGDENVELIFTQLKHNFA